MQSALTLSALSVLMSFFSLFWDDPTDHHHHASGDASPAIYVNHNLVGYEDDLSQGIEAFYQSEWEQADKVFESLIRRDEDDPRPYFFKSMIPFWAYFFGGNEQDAATEFLERSGKAIQVAERRLESQPSDTSMVLFLSGLYGYRALVAANEKDYKIAMQSGFTGFGYTRQMMGLNKNSPNARLGKGIFLYMTGSIPKEVRWMANMMGMAGDKEMGFAELEAAAESDNYVSTDALMILCYLYSTEGMTAKALEKSEQLTKRYKNNLIFQYYNALCLENTGNHDRAIAQYQKIAERNHSYLETLQKKSQAKLADSGSVGSAQDSE